MIRTDGPLEVGGVKASGETFPLQIDSSGNLLVSSSGGGGGGAVTIADGADVTQGTKADSAATDSTSSWTVIALLKGLYAKLAGTLTIGGTVTATGPLTDTQLRATAVPVSLATAPSTSVTQGTSPWVIAGAVTNAGTFVTQSAITAASGSVASGAIASGAVASGAVASGAVASGAFAAGAISDGADVTFGAKADAKSTATDTTPITAMSVLKQISASVQAPPSQAVTNTGTFAVQATQTTSPWIVAGGGTAGTAASGVATIQGIASMTPVQVSQATASSLKAQVVGAGTAGTADAGVLTIQGIASMTKLLVTPDSVALPANQSVNVAQINAATPLMGSGNTGTGSLRVTLATDQPQLTNKLLVTPDANSAINLAQVNGTTTASGSGTATGAVRVELPTNGTGVVGLNAGSNLVGYVGGKNTYAGKTTLTTTNFTSLTNTSGWQSASIGTSGARDVHFEIQTKGGTSGTNYVDFYIAETLSNGTIYADAATGSEGTFTAGGRLNSRYIGSIRCNAGTNAVQGTFKLSDVFTVIPTKFAMIAINNTGGTMSTTAGDHVFDYELVN